MTTTSIQRRQASEIFAVSLRECGIGVNLHYLPPAEFYAPGPEGILFGRDFDLAQFGMGSESLVPQCDWFNTDSIPNAANDWFGANLSGFSNKDYDQACAKASFTLSDELDFERNYQETLRLYAETLPTISLYPYLNIAASRVDLCGFELDPSAATSLWLIGELNYGNCGE